MAARSLPPVEFLRECFSYNPETGELRWKERPLSHFKNEHSWKIWNSKYSNKPAGRVHTPKQSITNYYVVTIKINGEQRQMLAHRVIYLMVHGELNTNLCIDHIDQDGTNNKISNLRAVSHKINMKNTRRKKNNSTGYCGVYPAGGRFVARLKIGEKMAWLGSFETIEEAAAAHKDAKLKHGYTKRHGT
jgi:hypothetical protein